jgi:putative DNA primase/helicase
MTALDKRGYGDQLREKRMEKVVEANAYEIDLGIPLPAPIVPPATHLFDCSDEGNGDRLITQYGRDLVYSVAEKRWYIWDGIRWMRDETLMIHALAKRVSRTIYIEAANSISDNDRARLGKWAVASSMQPRIKAMIDAAAPLRAVRPDDLDTHEWYLNCRNGTIELDTCKFREANRDDLLTKCTGVVFDKYAECPQWTAHLDTIFDGDTSYIQTFQEFCGYCLLQYNPEQIMAIFYGVGKNGKSVTLATVARVLGDYAVNLPADSLAVKRSDNPDAARSDLAVLKGARLAWAVEGESGAVMAESMIKTMTGDDKVRVRRQYEHGFEFRPGAKIVLATNHEPVIKGTDAAIWRRIWLFPFTVVILEENRDPRIMEKLLEEGSGILNWMLIGLRRYLKRGRLIPAEKVVAATRRYRTDQDRIGQFIREKMKVDAGPDGTIPRPRFYSLYKQWCDDEGERPRSSKAIAAYLRERGFLERKVGSERCWIGIRVKSVIEEREDDEDGSTQEVI